MVASSSDDDDEVPFYLMPVAAALGLYTLVGFCRTVYLVYANNSQRNETPPRGGRKEDAAELVQIGSQPFVLLVVSWIITFLLYSFVVARVERAVQQVEYNRFDPYEILGLSQGSADASHIKRAYRDLVKLHHPDKQQQQNGVDNTLFLNIQKAYETLTDTRLKYNYETYGHPDGPLSTPVFSFALPMWLLFPQGNVALIMMVLYMCMIAGLIYYVVKQLSPQKAKKNDATILDPNSISGPDLSYLVNHLKPDSTYWEILTTVISTPENIAWSLQDLEKVEAEKQKRKQQKSNHSDFDDLVNQGGWDDDDDEEEEDTGESQKARQAEREDRAQLERLRQATGQATVLLEDLDDGVLGQKWVEQSLRQQGVWPPHDLGVMQDETYKYMGKQLAALDHPGLRRLLCMTIGRLNSTMLNAHPELLEAGSKKLIDQTYFKSSMEFRHRVGMLLEAVLRVAMTMRSRRLLATAVETIAMFKIGCSTNALPWFNGQMTRTYGMLPRLKVLDKTVTCQYDEIATGDQCELSLELERIHAEAFLKQKLAIFKKQGIPPQAGLQTYREVWWFMLQMKRVDGEILVPELDVHDLDVAPETLELFRNEKERILTAWPLVVQNVAQKTGKIKIQFKAPEQAGQYQYFVTIKSQDFLGADQEVQVDVTVVDSATVTRDEKEPEPDGDEDEAKKVK